MRTDAAVPTAIPAIVPDKKSQGNSRAMAAVSMMRHATIICPILWKSPPATLTETVDR